MIKVTLTKLLAVLMCLSIALACHPSCICDEGSNVCKQCRLDFIGSQIDCIQRSCPCPVGYYTSLSFEGEIQEPTQCDYEYGNGEYSSGCYNGCKDFATLDEAKAACNVDPNCKAITYSFKEVGGSLSTDAITGFNHGYQLRASAVGSVFLPNKENSWLKRDCPPDQPHLDPCDFEPRQGTYLGGCAQDCLDFSNLADAEAACRLDPNCGGVTFSRAEIGGSASTNAFDGNWGFQLRSGTGFVNSPNGENSWKKIPCHTCVYGYAFGQFSSGCAQNCKDFATLDEAKVACDADPTCNAITYSFAGVGGSESTDAITGYGHGYQLRSSLFGSVFLPNKENTWLKNDCPCVLEKEKSPCDFEPEQGTYLAGCAQNCKDYPTLAAAEQACRLDPSCGGVTFSRAEIGGSASTNAYDGNWGFQLRSGNTFINSPNGENSWRKKPCPVQPFCCKKLINPDGETPVGLDACKLEIGLKVPLILVETDCHFLVEVDGGNDYSYVVSHVTLNINPCSMNEECLDKICTKLQYLNPHTNLYEDLPAIYYTAESHGGYVIKIPLIKIYDFAISTTVNPDQIVQTVYLQIFIGTCDKYLRVHQWKLYVYTNRNEVQVFQIDIDMQVTNGCGPGESCIVVADLDIIGEIVTDSNFNVVKPLPYVYAVGDIFYARIKFADPTYTKKLSFVSLYYKNDVNQVFDFTGITNAAWSTPYLEISLPLVEPSMSAIIQISMLIETASSRRMRALDTAPTTTTTSAPQTTKTQFTATVVGKSSGTTATPSSSSNSDNNQDETNKVSALILLFNIISFFFFAMF